MTTTDLTRELLREAREYVALRSQLEPNTDLLNRIDAALSQAPTGEPRMYARDLDGTGSLHACAKTDDGAIPLYGHPAATAKQPPAGTVSVPREPTKEMSNAGKYAMKGSADMLWERERAIMVYKAMLAAGSRS